MPSLTISVGGVKRLTLEDLKMINPEEGQSNGIPDEVTIKLSPEQVKQLAEDLKVAAEHCDLRQGEVIVWLNGEEQTVTVECRH